MKYNFNQIEAKWQQYWAENQTFRAANNSQKPKYYVLDMFPYPSGAGLHVGHPLGYIASDIYARYKRHKGFNVLHPQGYDSFGLPAEQYAIQTGQHPALTTEKNIKRYREQLDKMGFSFDWSREVRTSDPEYYKWTQWIFIQLFDSWYDNKKNKARPISELESIFSSEGNLKIDAACDDDTPEFTAEDWNSFSSEEKQKQLLKYRLTYLAETEVNWVPQLGTVLANDEIVNGVSERGGYPVVRKKMTQWSMRISAYAERLLQGLDSIDWTESLKESQRNWIGKSVGAEVKFSILTFPKGEGNRGWKNTSVSSLSSGEGRGEDVNYDSSSSSPPQPFPEGREPGRLTGNREISGELLHRAKEMRKNPTPAEAELWEALRSKKLDVKFRRQHPINNFIVDFVCLSKKLIIEVDGEIHLKQKKEDADRKDILVEKLGYKLLRFTNEQVLKHTDQVVEDISRKLDSLSSGEGRGEDANYDGSNSSYPQPFYQGREQQEVPPLGDRGISVFTTRPDTIFGVTFMTLAPEHELVPLVTTPEQKEEVEAYVQATAKRSERERMADVKTITGVFTGGYAEHPFTKEPVPIWIGDYVLAGYGTGAVMAVPCGDQRDYDFAKHFAGQPGMPKIRNIFKDVDISEEAFSGKEGTVIANSGFLSGLPYKEALKKAISELEKIGLGKGKINYRLRDAVFSRQRYWGEPFPVYYVNDMPQMISEEHLPIRLPEVEKYLPTETGEPPLGNSSKWVWDTEKNEVVENDKIDHKKVFPLELNTMPGWAGSSWYLFRYMDADNHERFVSQEAQKYWENVDLYIGGNEHATGHLLYSRFWTKLLKDRQLVTVEEPFKKLINQGMILGESAFINRIGFNITFSGESSIGKTKSQAGYGALEYLTAEEKTSLEELQEKYSFVKDKFLSEEVLEHFKKKNKHNEESKKIRGVVTDYLLKNLKSEFDSIGVNDRVKMSFTSLLKRYNFFKTHVPVEYVNLKNELDEKKFQNWQPEFSDAEFIQDKDGITVVTREVEKMSKSKYNVVNPDNICEDYGADTLRMYEMFLGPLEQAKPWNTAGITGVHNFLKKLWKLYQASPSPSDGGETAFHVSEKKASAESLKSLHKAIKKVTEDIENFSFNTSVSTFMICVNELSAQKCNQREVLEPLAVLIAPYAPHIAEEIWEKLGHKDSVVNAEYPVYEEKYLVESTKEYPISFNGKMRFTLELPLDLSKDQIERSVMEDQRTVKQLEGRPPKKIIVVPGKIVNIVG